jgi:hypothetical protein
MSEQRIVVAEAQGQFGNTKEGDHLPLKVITIGLVKTQQTEET